MGGGDEEKRKRNNLKPEGGARKTKAIGVVAESCKNLILRLSKK
jgi:hypothetical protein